MGGKTICDALHDLIPFVQFKKREKHPSMSVTFSKVAVKSNTPPWVFFTFSKLYKWYKCNNVNLLSLKHNYIVQGEG